MRNPVYLLITFCLFLPILFLSSTAGAGERLAVKGFLSVDKRFLTEQTDVPIVDLYNDLQIELRAQPGEKLSILASLDARYYDNPEPTKTLESYQDINTSSPLDLNLWEGYLDIYGFLLNNLDLRLGKQRIVWGTADKLNQTDNLNPDDFSDPLDFGRKIPSTAFMATYYLGDLGIISVGDREIINISDWELIGIWLPTVRQVLLPKSGFDPAALLGIDITQFELPTGSDPADIRMNVHTNYPSFTLPDSMGAVKLKGNLFNTDFSFSYFHGYDDIPVPSEIEPTDMDPLTIDVYSDLPTIDVFGFDLAGELLSVGFWFEGAVFIPDLEIALEGIGPLADWINDELDRILKDRVLFKKSPYFKYTIGTDYTFKSGFYLNCQVMHGFFNEAGKENLGNYVMARAEKSFLHGKLKINLMGGLAAARLLDQEFSFGDQLKDTLAYFAVPEIQYLGIDSLEFSLGYFFLDGEPGTLLGSMTDQDQIYLRAKASF